jgi:hypothetical protein
MMRFDKALPLSLRQQRELYGVAKVRCFSPSRGTARDCRSFRAGTRPV